MAGIMPLNNSFSTAERRQQKQQDQKHHRYDAA